MKEYRGLKLMQKCQKNFMDGRYWYILDPNGITYGNLKFRTIDKARKCIDRVYKDNEGAIKALKRLKP